MQITGKVIIGTTEKGHGEGKLEKLLMASLKTLAAAKT